MKQEEILDVLRKVAPGTTLRDGLDNILKAKTGALIVLSESDAVMNIVDGGFKLDLDFTPASIYELCKMDGAIVVSSDLKKILRANVQLVPDPKIKTVETGTRHRTAERTAKQTNEIVICISQRRGIITIFKGDFRYVIKEINAVNIEATQMLETLEKYKKVLIGKYTDPDKLKLSEMHVVLSDKNIFVNGTEQKVYDYALFEHMIVIIFQNKTNILVPERVFNNEEERKTFIEGIHGICPLYQKSEVTNG